VVLAAAEPAPAAKPSKKKDTKGKKDMSSLFAALGEDGEPAGAADDLAAAPGKQQQQQMQQRNSILLVSMYAQQHRGRVLSRVCRHGKQQQQQCGTVCSSRCCSSTDSNNGLAHTWHACWQTF
jgi:hypothetical protein